MISCRHLSRKSVILIPYRIGFGIDLSAWEQIMNYCFDSSFAVDVVLNFFTGYYDEDVLVCELRKIRQRYLRSWFIFDVASTVPLDQFLQVVTNASSSLLTLKLIRVFRLFRLLKLMRLLRLKRAMEAVQVDALNAHVFQTIKSLLTIIFIIHLVACGWYMFYTWDPTGPNWVTNIEPQGFKSPYLVSFYWVSNTMMSVGYGDIYGITDGERLYSIFVACLGSICVDRMSDVLFVLDVVLSFFTTYVDETGVEIVDRKEIRRHYLKTAFFVDIMATIPFDFVIEAVAAGNAFKSLRLIRTLKLIKLLRLMRLSKLLKMNSQWMAEFDINVDTVRLLKLLAPVMIIAHYVGCIWYYMSADRDPNDAWWGGKNVYFEYPDSIQSKYIASIYWAITTMTTVGFGDIFPINDLEKGYCILVLIGGTTLFAYVVGTVIEVASNSKSLMNREHEMVQRVNAYIKERGVSSEFIVACQEHLRFVDSEKTLFVESSLLDALSYSLRSELTLILNGGVVSKIRFFDKKPKWFLTLILPRLVPQFFLEGDILIYQDNPVSGIFFLMNGAVIAKTRHFTAVPDAYGTATDSRSQSSADHVIADHQGTIAKIYEGEFFGYKETLTETVAQYNLFAMRATGTYLLPRECLDDFEAQYPRVMDEIRSLIIQSITRQQKVASGWQNNDAIGLTPVDRERVAELNITRRGCDHDTIRASVSGVSMLGRRHSSFVSTSGLGRLAQTVAAEIGQYSPRSDASTTPRREDTEEQTTVEVLAHVPDQQPQKTARRSSAHFAPGSPILLPGSMEAHATAVTQMNNPAASSVTVLPMTGALHPDDAHSRRPNSATTLSAVHPSGSTGQLPAVRLRPDGAATMNAFRTGRKTSISIRDVGASQRRPSGRYVAMRENDVTALVDKLLSGDGFQIQRTGSGRTQKPTVTN
ncbi:hypothetical protein PF005_g1482 [Phytophthora fragariae]|uniref:Ion transport domain-containing protein n=1 Tax=Phytophthora fragariae TaxID=53985 RepID=A0A6A3ZET5_9STRA|nr:hypothetical protein PF004_g10890 [Phytophthora fragariae]KAE9235444.1 hypothetical protein PF005_g1482 [Phytophthora fragariae]